MPWYGGTPEAERRLKRALLEESDDSEECDVSVVRALMAPVAAVTKSRAQLYQERVLARDRALLAQRAETSPWFVDMCLADVAECEHPASTLIHFHLRPTLGTALEEVLNIAATKSNLFVYVGITCGPLFRWCRQGALSNPRCTMTAHDPKWG